MEQKKDQVQVKKSSNKVISSVAGKIKDPSSDESDISEDEHNIEEFVSWRKKC